MKKLAILALAAFAFTACSDDNNPTEPVRYDVISFEKNEAMVDFKGNAVALGSLSIAGFNPSTFTKVLCGKAYMADADTSGNYYDGLLFSTADGAVNFGSYFTDFKFSEWGAFDTWGGFALSQNFDKTATANGTPDYTKQFSAWTTTGASSSATFAIAYDNSFDPAYTYNGPKIVFSTPRTVGYCHLANATVTAQYESPKGDTYFFKVVATGYNGATKGQRVEHVLINGKNITSAWAKVDLTQLGAVTEIRFSIESNDLSGTYLNPPAYFCIDEIGVVSIEK